MIFNKDDYYTPKEISIKYNFSLNTVYQWILRHHLPSENHFGRIFVPKTTEGHLFLLEKQKKFLLGKFGTYKKDL